MNNQPSVIRGAMFMSLMMRNQLLSKE